MRCPRGIELEKVHDDALRNYEESLNANRTGATREWIQSDILDKAVGVQIAYDALTDHIAGCSICQGIPKV
jgi:hypothetical protein